MIMTMTMTVTVIIMVKMIIVVNARFLLKEYDDQKLLIFLALPITMLR